MDVQPSVQPEVSHRTFQNGIELLRLIVLDLRLTAEADLSRRELDRARVKLKNVQAEYARLDQELHHRFPPLPQSPDSPNTGSHARRIAQEMVDYVHCNYHHPIGLAEAASRLKMNAAYLSTLFSRTMGVTFHQYLDEYRLSKAKELLCNPDKRIWEIACAVGYTSSDYFRHAFKAHTGLSPSAWRMGP